jgi:hypothetical protein
VHTALGRLIAIAVERSTGACAHEIIDQRVAWSGIAGDRISPINERDVHDAASIEDRDWVRAIKAACQSLMEDRHQWRALAASGYIGGTKS